MEFRPLASYPEFSEEHMEVVDTFISLLDFTDSPYEESWASYYEYCVKGIGVRYACRRIWQFALYMVKARKTFQPSVTPYDKGYILEDILAELAGKFAHIVFSMDVFKAPPGYEGFEEKHYITHLAVEYMEQKTATN